MRWKGRAKSSNVDDRRRRNVRRVGTGIGVGGALLILAFALLTGEDPGKMLQQAQQRQVPAQTQSQGTSSSDELADFVSTTLKFTEDVWNKLFREQLGQNYKEPILVLYEDQISSACGYASSASGPFYCPGDYKLYIDLSFYNELQTRFRAPGDFAMAYIVAHEVGHHVQNLLGITRQVQSQRGRISKAAYNDLSVRLELQADFLAGVWAHHSHKMDEIIEKGDIEEALNAANAVGDDRIQKETMGYVVPDAFTHGTSDQRMRWFMKGLKSGNLNEGDTFAARNL
jgi:predicted metalloprotease